MAHTVITAGHSYKGKLLKPMLKKIKKVDLLITETTTLTRLNIKSKTEAELAVEIAEKTKDYDQVLVLMSTTNIDRVTTLQRVANKTGKTVIHDILLSNVLQLVTQKIPNALNSKKVQVFLPSFIYLLKDKPEYQQYIEPFKEKMKYTGRALHGKFILNVRVSMLRDIIKLKEKSKVLTNPILIYRTMGSDIKHRTNLQ